MKAYIKSIDYSSKKLLVVGDLMIDKYIYGNISRISPEYPVPVFKYKTEDMRLGGAANTANNISAIGCEVDVFGAIGNDEEGVYLTKLLKQSNIGTNLLKTIKNFVTITKTRFLNQNNAQILRLDKEEILELSEQEENWLLDKFEKFVSDYSGVVISDYMKGFLSKRFTQEIINISNKHDVKTFIDVKDTDYKKYQNCYLLKPNLNELQALTKKTLTTMDEIIDASKELKKQAKVKNILVTLGSKGMLLIDEKNNIKTINTVAKEVFDVTGAGDTVLAYVSALNASGVELFDAVELSNVAAGVKVSKAGTVPISFDMIDNSDSNSKIIKRENWSFIKNNLGNKKVVFTNGCFDVIHAGHIESLKFAKSNGDILVVGLNSDSSIKKLKGEDRPINCFEDRAKVLSELSCVDYIIEFGEETPYNLIKMIVPNILVKSEDYRDKFIAGRDIVENNGGKVVLAPFVKGLSSTNIINKSKNGEK